MVERASMAISKPLVFLYVISQSIFLALALRTQVRIAKSGCQSVCGNLSIPYPFGIGEGCYKEKCYEIICKYPNATAQPYLAQFNAEVVKLSLERISVFWTDNTTSIKPSDAIVRIVEMWNLTSTPFVYSVKRNSIVAKGCNMVAYINLPKTWRHVYTAGCVSACGQGMQSVGCNARIPSGLKTVSLYVERIQVTDYHPSIAIVSDGYKMEVDSALYSYNASVSLDWVMGAKNCTDAVKDTSNYACGDNSDCVDSINGPGYKCLCSKGYQGNPYLPQGCQEIDNCASPNECTVEALCINTPTRYYCECPHGYRGDGRTTGSGCTVVTNKAYLITIGIGIGISVIALVATTFWLYRRITKGNKELLKRKFFNRNGGLLLQKEIVSGDRNIKKATIFCQEELEKATNYFSRSRILGRGGYGTVYKGMLQDGSIVAIKKSRHVDRKQTEQFINELVILSQINHKNVVRLYGCCLETDVPLLVYEYISNGTLSDHLHGDDHETHLSWKTRLRISIEISAALAYLHASTLRPVFHRDIKSGNILLDKNFKAIVSDFGLSRTVPSEQSHLSTAIQGTFGYLDPEYFHSGKFTEKSDVYGFGVILVELLTGKKPLFFSDSGNKNLSMYFISSMKENRLFQVLDSVVANEASEEEVLVVAKLAKKCLKPVGKKRPTMREVTMELERLSWPREIADDSPESMHSQQENISST